MASSGGGYNSITSSEPWDVQSKYLKPIFQSALYGATGRVINPEYDPNATSGTKSNKYMSPNEDTIYSDFFDTNYKKPGGLDYWGTQGNNSKGWWQDALYPILNLTNAANQGGEDIGAPSVAKFTEPQLQAQEYTQGLADSRLDSFGKPMQSSLLGKSETALGNVITGANEIPYWNIDTPTINDPGDITGRSINYTPNMSGATVNYSPQMQAASLGYDFWNPLGVLAGGDGGNEYLDDMITAATRGINRNYLSNVIPNINSAAEDAGARGSGAWEDLRTNANKDYLESIGDVEANIRGTAFDNQLNAQMQALGLGGELSGKESDYEQEANRLNIQFGLEKALANAGYGQEANRLNTQLGLEKATTEAGYGQEANVQNVMNDLQRYFEQAGITSDINKQNAVLKTQTDTQNIDNILQSLGFAPELNQAGYSDIAALSASGAEQQQMNQDVLNAYIQKFEQGELAPWNEASLLSQLVGGNFGGTVTQSAQQTGGK